MNIMSQMSQWSQGSDPPTSKDPRPSSESGPTSMESSQAAKTSADDAPAANTANLRRKSAASASMSPRARAWSSAGPSPGSGPGVDSVDSGVKPKTFTSQWLGDRTPFNQRRVVKNLIRGVPASMGDYAEHLYKVACLLYDCELTYDETNRLERKYVTLTGALDEYTGQEDDPSKSQLYVVVEKCFDVFIKMAMNGDNLWVATHTIRFLTTVMMQLNYWELHHLLRARPAIYPFSVLIGLDFHECYARFLADYDRFTFEQEQLSSSLLRHAAAERKRRRGSVSDESSDEVSDGESVALHTDPASPASLTSRDKAPKKRRKSDLKLVDRRVLQKSELKVASSTRSSNYDPDVVHECQLPSPEDSDKVCLRRFSRKYELIRHQETVHSKKKKLFKCYVCVKQDPSSGPRIFTRHDTLAKHIRVNHRISGKEAKAEVAFSKKNAEIVEEGDITVQVGRRKTKVDFELRAHMDKKGSEGEEGSIIYRNIDESAPDSIHSGDEGLY